MKLFKFIFLFIGTSLFAQNSIQDRIDNQLQLSISESDVPKLIATFSEIESHKNILDYKSFIGYLFVNFKNQSSQPSLIKLNQNNPEVSFKFYRETLKNDSLFTATLDQIYINSELEIDKKPTYSFERVMDIASNFVMIDKLTNQGNYSVKICTGINSLEKTQLNRNAGIEAFCFIATWNYFQANKTTFSNIIKEQIIRISKLELGINEEERILRAQGALMVLMFNNNAYRDIILSAYKEHREILPFKILP